MRWLSIDWFSSFVFVFNFENADHDREEDILTYNFASVQYLLLFVRYESYSIFAIYLCLRYEKWICQHVEDRLEHTVRKGFVMHYFAWSI